MKIKEVINVRTDRLSAGLSAALSICHKLQSSRDESDVLDFSETRFITPTFVVPLLVYLKSLGKNVPFENMNEYLHKIRFDSKGVDASRMRRSEFAAYIENYAHKSYIPLIRFPADSDNIDIKDSVLESVETIIRRQTGFGTNIVNGLKYMVSEIADNICEHSMSGEGYIFAQSYSNMKYIDICLGDNGMTLLVNYKTRGGFPIESDIEAIMAANSGLSTKNRPEAENRGYGIRTTRKMLVKGLGGQYMMLSGSAVYICTQGNEGYLDLPFKTYIKGTIIALRIPFENKGFNYVNYME